MGRRVNVGLEIILGPIARVGPGRDWLWWVAILSVPKRSVDVRRPLPLRNAMQ